jgi:hypothetical protein
MAMVMPWRKFTYAAAKTLAGYHWLRSLCKGLVVNPYYSPKKCLRG